MFIFVLGVFLLCSTIPIDFVAHIPVRTHFVILRTGVLVYISFIEMGLDWNLIEMNTFYMLYKK